MAQAKKSKQTKAKQKPNKAAGKGAHWTKMETAMMLALLKKDNSAVEIAKKLGRPLKSVESKIYRERQKQPAAQEPVQEAVVEKPVEEPVEAPKPVSKWEAFFNWLLGSGK
jgi:hypothetical protein